MIVFATSYTKQKIIIKMRAFPKNKNKNERVH
jgi:hypothetical protein